MLNSPSFLRGLGKALVYWAIILVCAGSLIGWGVGKLFS